MDTILRAHPLWNGGKWEVMISELAETSMVVSRRCTPIVIGLRVGFQDAGNAGDNVLSGQAWILVGRERQIELVVQHGI